MSASITPSSDLLARSTAPRQAPSPFTTFTARHFVRPAASAQPTAPTFTYGLCDMYVAAPLDLDYDEPNAVCDADAVVVRRA
jgi:hypothetical protein